MMSINRIGHTVSIRDTPSSPLRPKTGSSSFRPSRLTKSAAALATFFLLVSLAATVDAAQFASNGAGGGSWGNPATWIPAGIPGVGDDATIAAGDTVTLGAPQSAQSVTLTANADTALVLNGFTLSLYPDSNNPAGLIILPGSDPILDASVLGSRIVLFARETTTISHHPIQSSNRGAAIVKEAQAQATVDVDSVALDLQLDDELAETSGTNRGESESDGLARAQHSSVNEKSIVHAFSPDEYAPRQVGLKSFAALDMGLGQPVMLTWETDTEVSSAGFHIYSGIQGGARWFLGERLTTDLIAATGNGSGANYEYQDAFPLQSSDEERAYYLEDVDLNGGQTIYGPVLLSESRVSAVDNWLLFE